MIIGHLRERRIRSWHVALCQANYRPERRFVEVEKVDTDDPNRCCVGFGDTLGEANRLFDTVVRTLLFTTGGTCDSVDWMELPAGEWIE